MRKAIAIRSRQVENGATVDGATVRLASKFFEKTGALKDSEPECHIFVRQHPPLEVHRAILSSQMGLRPRKQ